MITKWYPCVLVGYGEVRAEVEVRNMSCLNPGQIRVLRFEIGQPTPGGLECYDIEPEHSLARHELLAVEKELQVQHDWSWRKDLV